MGFSTQQIRLLRKQPHHRHLRTRQMGGREFTYIEGWHAIGEANRIFGFDGWDRETVEARCISAREVHGVFRALYAARVRVTVRADGVSVVREGSGTSEARAPSFAEAHDTALKSAETDATKRALATFGKPFGLALYLRTGQSGKITTSQPRHDSDKRTPTTPDASSRPATERDIRRQTLAPSPKQTIAVRPRPDSCAAYTSSLAPKETNTPPQKQASDVEAVPASQPSQVNEETDTERLTNSSNEDPPRSALQSAAIPKTSSSGEERDPDPLRDDGHSQIDKSQLTHGAVRRYRDKQHLQFVAAQPCLICSRQPSDAHHLRFTQPRAIGRKVSDQYTVPLCRLHHRELHQSGHEQSWWEAHNIDPLPIASELWSESRLARLGKPGSSILSRAEP